MPAIFNFSNWNDDALRFSASSLLFRCKLWTLLFWCKLWVQLSRKESSWFLLVQQSGSEWCFKVVWYRNWNNDALRCSGIFTAFPMQVSTLLIFFSDMSRMQTNALTCFRDRIFWTGRAKHFQTLVRLLQDRLLNAANCCDKENRFDRITFCLEAQAVINKCDGDVRRTPVTFDES